MPHKTVIRIAKLKTVGSIAASGEHTWRERPTHNADPARTHLNQDWRPVGNAAALVDAVKARVALADQKCTNADPVLCVEYLITAKADAFVEHGGTVDAVEYFRDALAWLEDKHGADNIVAVNIQNDEQAPHLVAYVVPLVQSGATTRKRSVIVGTNPDGTKRRETRKFAQAASCRLSAAHFFDGRKKLSEIQTDFSAVVGAKHGLERGIEGSKAKHTTIQSYYARASAAFSPLPRVTTPVPAKTRPEPVKPGLLASSDARAAYERDHAAWLAEVAKAEKQQRQRQAEVKAQRDAAVETARRHEAQAQQAEVLREQLGHVRRANGVYRAKLATAEDLLRLFRPDEIEKAKARAERIRQRKAEEAATARQTADPVPQPPAAAPAPESGAPEQTSTSPRLRGGM
ncbi:plasmid recombination protein [Laribacter hongkongensis]|uniref:MobV family relaxase n=1 Tax=Laribacter hongkongensis TaxID=168471 RepID=UPI001EFE9146|nr:MobV family relaxase [Laribacter hongkongensis]MCG9116989.1 plasmid recombination protein [Laribacter hongkongensis]